MPSQVNCQSAQFCSAPICQRSPAPPECASVAACSAPSCSDFEFSTAYTTCGGGCIVPFPVDSTGAPRPCDSSSQSGPAPCWLTRAVSSPLGCILFSASSPSECSARGGTWHRRAQNSSECLGRLGCLHPGKSYLTPKTAAACQACNGTVQPYFRWAPLGVSNGTWISHVWIPTRAVGERAAWGPGLDKIALRDAIRQYAIPHPLASLAYADHRTTGTATRHSLA